MVRQAARAGSGVHSGVPAYLRAVPDSRPSGPQALGRAPGAEVQPRRDESPAPIRLDCLRVDADQERARANRNRHGVALSVSLQLDWDQACWCRPARPAGTAGDRLALAPLNHVWYCVALRWSDGSWGAQAIRRANRREVTAAARLLGVSAYFPSPDKDGAINRAADADTGVPLLTPQELGGLLVSEAAAQAC